MQYLALVRWPKTWDLSRAGIMCSNTALDIAGCRHVSGQLVLYCDCKCLALAISVVHGALLGVLRSVQNLRFNSELEQATLTQGR
jgi:hypothetical protein